MESLESKLDRLSPDQRKEIEDFVDFLLFRSGNLPAGPVTAPGPVSRQNIAPPPLILQEPVHLLENSPAGVNDSLPLENSPASQYNKDPVSPVQEITVAAEDRITREYMDYGQFEQKTSPAITAVKNVKQKLQKREEQEKPRISLDWID
jgi:hypothetical protein